MFLFRGLQKPKRCHWSDEFQKKPTFFFGKSCSRGVGAPGCHPSTLIDLANKALASNGFVKAICLLSEGYRNRRGVTVPMNFKKTDEFFSETPAPRVLVPLAAIQAF